MGSVTAPSPPLLGIEMGTAVLLLAQDAAVTLMVPYNSVNSLFIKFIKFAWNDPNLSMPSLSC